MIDTVALRKKVIDLAIQGKLTQQLPEDGNAEDLYAQIQKEKAEFFKEGKIKKEELLPAISDDEIPFAIPKTWKWVRFGDLMWNRDSERIPVSVADRKKLSKNYDYYGASGVIDKVEKYIFDEKLLLIGEDGANLVSRSTPIAFIAKGKYWVNNHAHVLGCYKYDYLDFVMHYINSISLIPFVTGSAQPKLNQENMNKIPVPLPPLAEQIRIADTIANITSQIDIIDALQQQYESDRVLFKEKIIDAGIRGKLTQQLPEDGNAEDLYAQIQEEKTKLIKEGKIKKGKPLPEVSGDEIPFEIPNNWKWVLLGDTSYVERGGSPRPIKSYITDSETGINWIKIGDVEKGGKYIFRAKEKIIPEGEKKSRHVYPGDFLLTNSMSFGRPYISMIEGCIHDGWLLIRDLDAYNVDYLYHLLSSNYMYSQFCNKASGATVDNLNIDKVNTALVPLPPISEQIRIANRIDGLFKTIDHETERGLLWKTTKKVSHSSFRN